jgi:hypothetical protein
MIIKMLEGEMIEAVSDGVQCGLVWEAEQPWRSN